MKKTNLLILVSLIFMLGISNLNAKCRRTATVKYVQENGWSKKYTVDVTFLSGYELNQATYSYNYDMYSIYAVIFWGEGQSTVIKLKSVLICGSEVNCDCIISSFSDLQGYDQDGDKWNICVGDYCF